MEEVMTKDAALPSYVEDELAHYEEQIKKYRAGQLDETKMQKLRLHFGTYAQRQEGVQMQRIKIPGGVLSGDQLERLADAAERFGSGFLHFTTREDAQLYYLRLEEAPALLRFLAEAGITTREACGNTVRNITACYRAGTSPTEAFDVSPYTKALFQYLVRNKYDQNLGRKFKITFEGCSEDHARLLIHDIGFWAVTRVENGEVRRGFRVYLAGGLGGAPHLAQLYTEFLPVEELFNFAASALRLFDRYGERKARMKARMKFLVQTMGWDVFRAALDEERERVGPIPLDAYLSPAAGPMPPAPALALNVLGSETSAPAFQSWLRDAVIDHKMAGYAGVHVQLKLGDITSDRARKLADVVRRYSANEARVAIEQNIYLPWVRADQLFNLYLALKDLSLADPGAETVADVTTCPGSDTCRLGIASAKGLGSAISEAFYDGPLSEYRELARSLRVKISGCPNGCAQHSIANIGFHAAALSHDGKTVPAHLVFVGGQTSPDKAQFGWIVGKFPARSCIEVVKALLAEYKAKRLGSEDFNAFLSRVGEDHLKQILEPFRHMPSFEEDPAFYQDYGHENERFAIRQGIKGECAGSTVAATVPVIESAWEWLAQGEAYFSHEEYEPAMLAAYESAASAARVPLYKSLVDPFTSAEALWEFENLFVLSGKTHGLWEDLSARFDTLKEKAPDQETARTILDLAREFVSYCASLTDGMLEGSLAASA